MTGASGGESTICIVIQFRTRLPLKVEFHCVDTDFGVSKNLPGD